MVSLMVHAALVVVALFFIAVSVVKGNETVFEARVVSRPKMNLKKLKIPVNVEKAKHKPRLRKQIVVAPKINKSMPDIKIPEIVGIKGGLGAGSGGLGGAVSLGFSMPELNMFGVKGKGEKIFLVLDASPKMMVDEIGGVRAYEIIKSELVRLLEDLHGTVLFNIAVYNDYSAKVLFTEMVSASPSNVSKAKAWLEPLNSFTSDRNSQKDYGAHTTGEGGSRIDGENQIKPLKSNVHFWASPVMLAMEQQADTVFVLASQWGFHAYKVADASGWNESDEKRYQSKVVEARKKHEAENAERVAKGEPPRVFAGIYERSIVEHYFPGEPLPPHADYVRYKPRELLEAAINTRNIQDPGNAGTKLKSLPKKKKKPFTINVIHFTTQDGEKIGEFSKLTGLVRGQYSLIEGLDGIKAHVPSADE